MKKLITLLALGLSFASMVGCASAPENDQADAAPVATSEASADVPQSEPMPEAAPIAAQNPAPVLAEPPMAKSPSLGASSSGRGH